MKHKRLTRILALDLHPRSFGYVVIESPAELLGWGACAYRGKGRLLDVLAQRRLVPILELWRPSVLVLNSFPRMTQTEDPRRNGLLRRMVTEAKRRRIFVRTLKMGPAELKGRCRTKNENARRAVEHFPVLLRKLPPKRRAWESEHYRMRIFTAAILALTSYD
jgi:hypothetical protein